MKFLIAMILIASASAFAGHPDKKMEEMRKMPFDQHKKLMQEKLDHKTTMLEEAKTCVNEAKDNNALMDCHKHMKEEHHAMMGDMKTMKKHKK